MRLRIRSALFVVCSLGIGLLAETVTHAQNIECRGIVKLLVSKTEVEFRPNLSVCAIRQENYDKGYFNCHDQKNTDANGEFLLTLRAETFVFVVVNPPTNYTQLPTPFQGFAVADLKNSVIPDSATKLTKNRKQSQAKPALPQIILALYQVPAKQGQLPGPDASKYKNATTLRGNVVGAQHRAIVGADVFISQMGVGVGPKIIASDKSKKEGAFEIPIPARTNGGIYIFSVTAPGFRP